MVTLTAGRLPDPNASTTSSGIRMPVAVLPLCWMVVRNRMSCLLEVRDDVHRDPMVRTAVLGEDRVLRGGCPEQTNESRLLHIIGRPCQSAVTQGATGEDVDSALEF